jgi:type I restriction enzyme S subunit
MVDRNPPSEWKVMTLGDIGAIVTGKTPSTEVREYFDGDVPFVTPSDMDGRKVISRTERYLTQLGADSVKSGRVLGGAVMVSCIGSDMGKAAVAGRNCVTNQQINSIIVDRTRFCPDYVYYNLSTRKAELQSLAGGGSAQPILNKGHFSVLRIAVPPLPEQRAIAHILGTLDDKIELNRRMNETLEAMARAIFKSWFVDFDPVRAKAEGRQPFGMDAETAALFPDSFQDSSLGKIPKGWRVAAIGEDFRLTMGQSPPGETYNEDGDGLAFFQGKTDFGFRYPSKRMYCIAPTRLADIGDTLVSVRAPVGAINMANEKCCIGRGVAALRHKSGSRSYTFYVVCAQKEAFEQFEGEGTVFGSIGRKDFEGIQCVSPPVRLIEKFEQMAYPFDQVVENNERESRTLTAIRDALLPKLISGEIRVSNPIQIVEGQLH